MSVYLAFAVGLGKHDESLFTWKILGADDLMLIGLLMSFALSLRDERPAVDIEILWGGELGIQVDKLAEVS